MNKAGIIRYRKRTATELLHSGSTYAYATLNAYIHIYRYEYYCCYLSVLFQYFTMYSFFQLEC